MIYCFKRTNMLLDARFPLEIELEILSYLDIKPVMNVLLLCKLNYHTFHNYLLKSAFPDFYFTDTSLFHRAIVYNKCNIVKWLITNRILSYDHRVMQCQYYKKNYELQTFLCFHQEYIDITLSLACLFADNKMYELLTKYLKPITNSLKFNYVEYLVIEHSLNRPSARLIFNTQCYEYLPFFLSALHKYRISNCWNLSIKIYPSSDTS